MKIIIPQGLTAAFNAARFNVRAKQAAEEVPTKSGFNMDLLGRG
jgi:hypothetical protein